MKVPWMDLEKLGNDRLGEISASSRACVKAAHDIHTRRFSMNICGRFDFGVAYRPYFLPNSSDTVFNSFALT